MIKRVLIEMGDKINALVKGFTEKLSPLISLDTDKVGGE